MTDDTLFRSSLEIKATEGRTLTGIAVPYDRPTIVQDLVRGRPGPQYKEAFAPSSADISLAHRSIFPVFEGHNPGSQPLGGVRFERSDSERALLFEAPLSKTRAGDDALELVNDGAMRSVSIGFRPLNAQRRGDMVYRTEIAMRHLALAPTGYGQYEEAVIEAVRSEIEGSPDALVHAVDAALDAAIRALQSGNVEHGRALAAAGQITVDALAAAHDLGDGIDGEALEVTAAKARMAAVWSLAARRRSISSAARRQLPRF